MGLISRVSSRTYRKKIKKSLKNFPKMQLFVQGTTQLSNIQVATEAEFFNFIAKTEESTELSFSVNGAPVESFEELTEGATVTVNAKLLGGKVHGSLARAGKVKGQTPKVEAQEKKKRKTGRCKKRMQYNRRFVMESNTFGKKRGPNSQQQDK